jgi:hypothetical protein
MKRTFPILILTAACSLVGAQTPTVLFQLDTNLFQQFAGVITLKSAPAQIGQGTNVIVYQSSGTTFIAGAVSPEQIASKLDTNEAAITYYPRSNPSNFTALAASPQGNLWEVLDDADAPAFVVDSSGVAHGSGAGLTNIPIYGVDGLQEALAGAGGGGGGGSNAPVWTIDASLITITDAGWEPMWTNGTTVNPGQSWAGTVWVTGAGPTNLYRSVLDGMLWRGAGGAESFGYHSNVVLTTGTLGARMATNVAGEAVIEVRGQEGEEVRWYARGFDSVEQGGWYDAAVEITLLTVSETNAANATFAWFNSYAAGPNIVEVCESADFAGSPVFSGTNVLEMISPEVTVSGLSPETTYYWRAIVYGDGIWVTNTAADPFVTPAESSSELTLIDGLVALWTMDDTNSPSVDVINGLPLTWGGVSGSVSVSKINRSISFDREDNDYMTITNNPHVGISPGESFTLSTWVRINQQVNATHAVWSKRETSDAATLDWRLTYGDSGVGHWSFGVWNTNTVGTDQVSVATTHSGSVFYHVVCRYNSTNKMIAINVNGTQLSNSRENVDVGIQHSDSSLFVGRRYSTDTSNDLGGYVDESAIWKRCLSDDEVVELYNLGNGGTSLTLLLP